MKRARKYRTQYRSSKTGFWVTSEYAAWYPSITEKQRVRIPTQKRNCLGQWTARRNLQKPRTTKGGVEG